MSDKQEQKKKRVRVKVLKEILELYHRHGGTPLDITTTKDKLKHVKGIDSGKKFMEAVDVLVASGELVMDKGTIAPPTIAKPQGTITPLGEESNLVYGRVVKVSHDNLVFIPNDRKAVDGQIFLLNDRKTLPRFENKLVTLQLAPVGPNDQPMGMIVDILGEAGNPINEYDTIAQAHGAIMSWEDPIVKAEVAKIPLEVRKTDFNLSDESGTIIQNNGATETVVDLTHLNFTTTDPATCRDMDDAIYSTYDDNGNIIIYTAVADVTRYVHPKSAIAKQYFRGGFTFYASNKAYNILPTELSTGICSLNPNENRMAFVVKTTIDRHTGKPIESKFMSAMIRSHEKFSYEQAQAIVDENPTITPMHLLDKTKSGASLTREEQVVMNKVASDLLARGFATRHSIQFNTRNEYKPVFSEDGLHIIEMAEEENCAYHKVIENFMVTANEEAAKFALVHNIPIVYRVHDEPNDRKIDQAYEFFGYLDIPFEGDLSPSGTRQIIESVKGTYKEKAVNNFLVRMQSKAKYSISTDPKSVELLGTAGRPGNKHHDNRFVSKKLQSLNRGARNQALAQLIESVKDEERIISHFGLQSEHYSHTTSPIRRITDYVTHYNIKAFLNHTEMLPIELVKEIAQWANERQDAIDQAEREQQEFNSALYCEGRINEVMKGRICGFKSLVDGKITGAQDIMVIVENDETGVKVQIPAIQVLGEKLSTVKDITISQYGSALINKTGSKALLTLCEEVTFKIAEASRVTKTVYASTDLTKDFTTTNYLEEILELGEMAGSVQNITNPIHQRNLYEARRRAEEERNASRKSTKKTTKEGRARVGRAGVAADIDEEEAEGYRRQSSKQYRSHKQYTDEDWDSYTTDDIIDDSTDDNTSDDDDIM